MSEQYEARITPFTLARNRRALESCIRGLNNCVQEQGYPISAAQQIIMETFTIKLEDLDGLTEETYKDKHINFSQILNK